MATLFEKIIARDIPADVVFEDDHCIVIKDINPAAPVHVLIIPKKPIPKLADAETEDQALLGHLMLTAGEVARQLGVEEGFRLIVNNGEGGGQTVFHLHLHLLAGRDFTEAQLAP
jgi:histidine triad (HIT) family protein